MFSFTASAKTVFHPGTGRQLVDMYGAMLSAGLDEAFTRTAQTPIQGEKLYYAHPVSTINYTYKGMTEIGNVELNSDGDAIPFDVQNEGFEHTIGNYGYRRAIGTSRTLLEGTDRYGEIGNQQRQLISAAFRTVELLYADTFNRGFAASPFLCEDGMHFIDSDRPNPKQAAGNWSNLESSGALTQDMVTQARTNFRKYRNDSGHLSPQKLVRVLVSPDYEDTMKELVGGSLKPGTALNDPNVTSDIEFMVYDWLTTAAVYFQGDGQNELEAQWRVTPAMEVWQGENPDMVNQRVRFAMGVGCRRPLAWRGALIV